VRNRFKNFTDGLFGSYSQIFFTNHRWLAMFTLLASFIHPIIGLSGLSAVCVALLLGKRLGFAPLHLNNGTYTYNVLLSGFALGSLMGSNTYLWLMIPVMAVLSLFVTVWMFSFFTKYRLPILSLPFILSVWIFLLSLRGYESMFHLQTWLSSPESSSFAFVNQVSEFLELRLPEGILFYLRSMSFILFQQNVVAGILVSVGLLMYSRIAFSLSWVSFLSGYFLYLHLNVVSSDAGFSAFGFNFIFTAVSLCGFFLIPSRNSFLLAILTAPFLWLFIMACQGALGMSSLPLYSLPFSLVVLLVISALNNRLVARHFILVQYQQFSPEKNLYAYHTYMERFKKDTYVHIQLPVYGEWVISQGHEGDQTHREDWRYAWDFVVQDEFKRTFKAPGENLSDFYAYGLPVLAPADGYVVTVAEGIEDNKIGDVNLQDNWGNSLVIKHSDNLFSKLSHLKKDSIQVKQGDYVRKGDVLAQCGNSGRSPEPHIHFQLQNTPYIGAKTMAYPMSYYLTKTNDQYTLKSFDIPAHNETVMRPVPNRLLKKAFHFIPGQKMQFEWDEQGRTKQENWEVLTDAYNQSYLYCESTRSYAYFTCNDTLFYFTSFSGDTNSLMYQFYLAAYKVLLCYYPGLQTCDTLPVDTDLHLTKKIMQDFLAPFVIYCKPSYHSTIKSTESASSEAGLVIRSEISGTGSLGDKSRIFETVITENGIHEIKVFKHNQWVSIRAIAS
jgi:urea transporter/murein DD-endopeptidase MepM/ murein hydrolase activator NlpD